MSTSKFLALLAMLVGAALTVYGLHVYREANRFAILESGQKPIVYKLDRITGETWMVVGAQVYKVKDPETESPEEKAIRLAKSFRAPRSTADLEARIRERLAQRKGPLRLHGWKAREVSDQTYVVSFTFDEGEGEEARGIYVEVHLRGELVRLVNGNQALEAKYGAKPVSIPPTTPGEILDEPIGNAAAAQSRHRRTPVPPPPPGFEPYTPGRAALPPLPPDVVLRKPDKPH